MMENKRIVVKIGTNVLSNENGIIQFDIVKKIVNQIVKITINGVQVVVVTSGAIGAGMAQLGLKHKPATIIERQACAALGQHILMMHYDKLFGTYGIKVAQILLSYDAFTNKQMSTNLLNTLRTLFFHNCIPIINENDVTSIDEIGKNFGDNDMLSAKVAVKIRASKLLILTNVDGLFDKNPRDSSARLITKIDKITKDVERLATKEASALGSGGMAAKIAAAKYATGHGCPVIILNGKEKNTLRLAMEGRAGTSFKAH